MSWGQRDCKDSVFSACFNPCNLPCSHVGQHPIPHQSALSLHFAAVGSTLFFLCRSVIVENSAGSTNVTEILKPVKKRKRKDYQSPSEEEYESEQMVGKGKTQRRHKNTHRGRRTEASASGEAGGTAILGVHVKFLFIIFRAAAVIHSSANQNLTC